MSEWPHVTAIVKGAGLIDTSFVKEEYLLRGTAIHLATQLHDEGDLEFDSIDPAIAARFAAYVKFLTEVNPKICESDRTESGLAIEEPVRNETYRYCGTLDRRVRIGGAEGVLDIKSSLQQARWHGLQLAAYAHCFDRPLRRWSLYLGDDSYRLVERKDPRDWSVFVAALTLTNWLEEAPR